MSMKEHARAAVCHFKLACEAIESKEDSKTLAQAMKELAEAASSMAMACFSRVDGSTGTEDVAAKRFMKHLVSAWCLLADDEGDCT